MENKYKYFKRDISWLSFNYRVLLEALDERLPLYERINFISIYSSNLEEFYKIRVADHKAVASGATESDEESVQSARELVEEINREVNRQLDDRVRIYEQKILPALQKNHIIFYQDSHVEPFHQQFIKDFFKEEIFPYLQPVPVSKDKIVSFLRDNRLYLAIRLYPKEERKEGEEEGEEGKEPTPVEGTTITFKNIYTYKRHHSSGDSGNGGGKKEEKPTVEIKDDDALGLNNTDHFAYIVGYGNGEVRPQNSITRAEVAAIFFRLLEDDVRDANYTRQNKFTDVSNDAWYCSAVSTLSAMGIISGYPDATFRPNASITRAEFAAIATRFDVNGDKTPASFNDIADHWAKDEIAVAANNGWVNGYEDGSFRPQNKITRAETMSLVNRVLNRKPETAEDLLENMAKWTDNADTNAWYYLAVQEATNSHYYEYKENSQYEKWTELRETRDWSELDK